MIERAPPRIFVAHRMAREANTDRKDLLRSIIAGRGSFLLVAACAIALYANTLGHGFALDDGLVLRENAHVLKGIRGIPDILTHDSFHGSIGGSDYLSGGRYRPLPLITYAVEVALFGADPAVHHAVNVLLYALTGIVLLAFLRRHIFRERPAAALVCTLLFVFHPIHTEVVANIKGRDEILSLLFLLSTFHYLLNSARGDGSKGLMWRSCFFLLLALLSKENGVIMVAMAPLTLHLFSEHSVIASLRRSIPLIAVVLAYVAVRSVLLGTQHKEVAEVMDNPYLLASGAEKIATILFVFLRYIGLLLFPHPLSYDYSYNQVPYRSFSDPWVWSSIACLGALLVVAARGIRHRDMIGWCVLFFLATWVLVSGALYNIGAPMAERFMYQGSLPFLIAVVELVRRLIVRTRVNARMSRGVITAALVPLLGAAAFAVVDRNGDWRSDDALLLHDVQVADHSARAHVYAGIALLRRTEVPIAPEQKRALCNEALGHFDRAERIKPGYVPTYLNKGVAYLRLDSLEAAARCWELARAIEPENPTIKVNEESLGEIHYKRGLEAGVRQDLATAIRELEQAVHFGPDRANAWYNLGGAHFTAGDTARARICWERTLSLQSTHAEARQGLDALNAAR